MEKLYNNIVLSDERGSVDFQNVPYLINPPKIIDVTVGRQLFTDNFLIDETDLMVEYHKAKKYKGNPIFFAEKSWEKETLPCACPKSGGVWYDEEEKKFKMWYEGGWLKNMCYAESNDGIKWVRPKLNVNGTNIILPYENFKVDSCEFFGTGYLRPDSTTFFIDYDCPKEEKYKMFLRNPGGDFSGMVATSSDGINFENFTPTGPCGDRSTIFYNPFRKKWIYSLRWWKNGRVRAYIECDNLIDGAGWKDEDLHLWMCCDDLDSPIGYVQNKPELYNVDCIGYESIMVGLFQVLYGPQNEVCEEYGIPKITELMPMYSRDGYHFSRPNRDSMINAAICKGTWDRGYIQSVGGTLIIHDDELWIYYTAFGGDENLKGRNWTLNGMYSNGATGLAKLRRDGFVSMNGNGLLVTKKLTFDGKSKMYVNTDGAVSAEIITAEGITLAKSEVYEGNSTMAELIFKDFDIKKLNGEVFRIKFKVNGKLYSFGFADENGDFGGAHAAGMRI